MKLAGKDAVQYLRLKFVVYCIMYSEPGASIFESLYWVRIRKILIWTGLTKTDGLKNRLYIGTELNIKY